MNAVASPTPGYSAEVERLFWNPEHAGPSAAGELRGEAGSAAQGCWAVFSVRPEAGLARSVNFLVYGCPHSIAACSRAAAELTGQPLAGIASYDPLPLREALGIPPEKTGRLLIIQDALRKCMAGWENGGLQVDP
jgi:hypothetical protein